MSQSKHPMKHFKSHDDQDLLDLAWGKQKERCETHAKKTPSRFKDHSIKQDWTPEDD